MSLPFTSEHVCGVSLNPGGVLPPLDDKHAPGLGEIARGKNRDIGPVH
jgi:hypothetical protein